jgi:hypothetical protein
MTLEAHYGTPEAAELAISHMEISHHKCKAMNSTIIVHARRP